jgi:hypothetical protein
MCHDNWATGQFFDRITVSTGKFVVRVIFLFGLKRIEIKRLMIGVIIKRFEDTAIPGLNDQSVFLILD